MFFSSFLGKQFSGQFGKTCKEALVQGGSTSGPILAPDVTNIESYPTTVVEYYKAYAGIHCHGSQHHIEKIETVTFQSCNEACDAQPECAVYAVRDN